MATETKTNKPAKKARKRTPVSKTAKKAKATSDDSRRDIGGSRHETSEALAYFARYFDQI